MHPEERTEIVQRLRSAEDHLGAVIGLLEAGDAPCEQVLHRLSAVRADLRGVGAILLDNQINYSEEIIQNGARPEEREAELIRLVSLYSLVFQYSDQAELMRNE